MANISLKVQEIPLRSDIYSYRQTCTLGDRIYELSFAFNAVAKLWHMDIADSNGNPLAVGIPMVLDYPLTMQLRQRVEGLPDGQLLMIRTSDGAAKDVNVMGEDIKLIYVEPA